MRTSIPAALLLLVGTTSASAATDCYVGPRDAASANAASFATMQWAPFGRPERGWAIYAPRIYIEIGSQCPYTSPGFAAALARWQRRDGLPATGLLDAPGFAVVNREWTLARPFVVRRRGGTCPSPPLAAALAMAPARDSYAGSTIQLRADALAAYRRIITAAQRSLTWRDSQWFTIFSGFRDPAADARRCAIEGNCQGIVRAACSAHRAGLAIDLHMGTAPGFGPDSSNDANRRALVRTAAYRWMLTNAGRFGFVNYVFEPWHWEWSPAEPDFGVQP